MAIKKKMLNCYMAKLFASVREAAVLLFQQFNNVTIERWGKNKRNYIAMIEILRSDFRRLFARVRRISLGAIRLRPSGLWRDDSFGIRTAAIGLERSAPTSRGTHVIEGAGVIGKRNLRLYAAAPSASSMSTEYKEHHQQTMPEKVETGFLVLVLASAIAFGLYWSIQRLMQSEGDGRNEPMQKAPADTDSDSPKVLSGGEIEISGNTRQEGREVRGQHRGTADSQAPAS
jgi:hypothetical protein